MGAKSNFFISDNVYFHHANYNFALESGAMVSAFLGKILIGLSDYDDNGQARFSPKKTIIIPASSFVEFVKTLTKAYNALKNKSEEKFEDLIYQHNPTHLLVGKYQSWENQWGFSMFYKCSSSSKYSLFCTVFQIPALPPLSHVAKSHPNDILASMRSSGVVLPKIGKKRPTAIHSIDDIHNVLGFGTVHIGYSDTG